MPLHDVFVEFGIDGNTNLCAPSDSQIR